MKCYWRQHFWHCSLPIEHSSRFRPFTTLSAQSKRFLRCFLSPICTKSARLLQLIRRNKPISFVERKSLTWNRQRAWKDFFHFKSVGCISMVTSRSSQCKRVLSGWRVVFSMVWHNSMEMSQCPWSPRRSGCLRCIVFKHFVRPLRIDTQKQSLVNTSTTEAANNTTSIGLFLSLYGASLLPLSINWHSTPSEITID